MKNFPLAINAILLQQLPLHNHNGNRMERTKGFTIPKHLHAGLFVAALWQTIFFTGLQQKKKI